MTTRRVRIARGLAIFLGLALLAAWAGPYAWGYATTAYLLHVAKRFLAEAEPAQAIPPLMAIEASHPDWAEVHYLLGVANRRAGHLTASVRHLEKASQLGWSKKDLHRQHLLGSLLAGDARSAEEELNKLLQRDINDDVAEEIYEGLAKAYLADYRLMDAKVCLEYWIQWRPEALQPRLWLAELASVGHDDSANKAKRYREILGISGDCYEAHLGLAKCLQEQNQVQEALAEYEWCQQNRPSDPRGPYGVATCQRRLGKPAEAKQILNGLLLDGKLPREHRGFVLGEIGQVALEEGQLDEAISLLQEAADIVPGNTSLHYALGAALSKAGKKEESKKELDLADRLGAETDRLSDVDRELLNKPYDADLRYEAGELLFRQGDIQSASLWLLSAVRWDPKHRKAHELLVEFYETVGRPDLAEQHRQALANLAIPDSTTSAAPDTNGPQSSE